MKLIDLLVKELPKRGGWPQGGSICWCDPDGEIRFDKDTAHDFYPLPDFVNGDDRACRIGNTSNGITRSQYESALAASGDWIEWGGGECPVETGVLVDVRYRDGQELSALPAKSKPTGERDASRAFWHNDGNLNDIIAYRLHKPDLNSRVNDDRLEQDLNECISQDVKGFALGFGGDKNPLISPAWNGDGIPPVGTECEIYNRSEWFAVKIKFIGDKWIVAEPLEGRNEECFENQFHGEDCYSIADKPHAFRPLRTEADKKHDAAKHAIAELCRSSASNGHSADLIMEAIAAGKIPGVKLEVK